MMTTQKRINLHRDMINYLIEKETEIEEEIVKITNEYYNLEDFDYQDLYDDILKLCYISLKQTYKLTIQESKKIYNALKKIKIAKNISNKEIDNFTYSKDNKTLAERIKSYINQAENNIIKKDVLLFYVIRILDNETLVVHHKLLKNKLKEEKIEYGMVVTGGGCNRDCCNASANEWIPIDEIEEPPYHPNCTCEIIYDDNELDDEEL